MITVVRKSGEVTRHITIYERGDQVPSGVRVRKYAERLKAVPGEYVTDMKGLMIPLLRVQRIGKQSLTGDTRRMFIFPAFAWLPHKSRDFIYPVQRLELAPALPIPHQWQVVITLTAKGVDIFTASCQVFKGYPSKAIWVQIRKMFRSETFVNALFERGGYMDKLRKRLIERGVDEEHLGDRIADLLQDKDAHPTMQRWAFGVALDVLTDKGRKIPDDEEKRQLQEVDLDNELEKRLLTQRSTVPMDPNYQVPDDAVLAEETPLESADRVHPLAVSFEEGDELP